MNCSSVDLKAYFLGEAAQSEKSAVEDHVRACQNCHEELDRLRLTQTALLSLEDEEMPQRIAFVSDKVFEPRWWQTIWRSGPAMGIASAAMLAAAILAHAYARPMPGPAQALDTAQLEQRIEREVNVRLDHAVAKAVSESEARQTQQVAKVLDAAEKRHASERQTEMAMVQQMARYYQQQTNRALVAVNERPGQ